MVNLSNFEPIDRKIEIPLYFYDREIIEIANRNIFDYAEKIINEYKQITVNSLIVFICGVAMVFNEDDYCRYEYEHLGYTDVSDIGFGVARDKEKGFYIYLY